MGMAKVEIIKPWRIRCVGHHWHIWRDGAWFGMTSYWPYAMWEATRDPHYRPSWWGAR